MAIEKNLNKTPPYEEEIKILMDLKPSWINEKKSETD